LDGDHLWHYDFERHYSASPIRIPSEFVESLTVIPDRHQSRLHRPIRRSKLLPGNGLF